MNKIDKAAAPVVHGTSYPAPYDAPCLARSRTRLGDAAGLEQFGVNLCRLPPGAWSSQRHWHELEDEFVYVIEGEVVLVTDSGEEVFRAGDCAGFKAGNGDGHHFQNRSAKDAQILEVGTRWPDESATIPISTCSPKVLATITGTAGPTRTSRAVRVDSLAPL